MEIYSETILSLGGEEDSEEGHTWGQQAATSLRERFGCSRMDKVFFTPGKGLRLRRFGRFGGDVVLGGDGGGGDGDGDGDGDGEGEKADQIVRLGFEKPWVTDHLGVVAEVEVVG
ncbi:uncharacterized protein GGS25DRAFT_517868 [Hypoxylon fragiforme]|uniref:uncharacterized protein n=1 Tax=Hypoxylon fragiforme TaxID=63214 RepID=UPI0020C5D397|nr:uncharacterized protein GGS25DRAFT_517868 [Hypoxylon fragiforme]KAI2612175.1 hypothetical protein GGS25DRAFT_517868 [Hypoxylon fragiforme]